MNIHAIIRPTLTKLDFGKYRISMEILSTNGCSSQVADIIEIPDKSVGWTEQSHNSFVADISSKTKEISSFQFEKLRSQCLPRFF
jgi:hypothetical protein